MSTENDSFSTPVPGVDPATGRRSTTVGATSGGAHAAGNPAGPEDGSAGVTGTGKEQAAQVAGTAKEQAGAVAGSAKSEAQDVLAEARGQAGDLLEDLRTQLSEQSEVVRDRVAGFLGEFGSELRGMADSGGGQGYATRLVQQVGGHASTWGDRLDSSSSADLLTRTRAFARRRPGAFLLGALAVGVVVGRVGRGAKAQHDEQADAGTAAPTDAPTLGATDLDRTAPVTGSLDAGVPVVGEETAVGRPLTTPGAAPASTGFGNPAPGSVTDEEQRR
ncbi:hypothetical protein ACFFKU_09685 [Kineococcus gynurae]|uniref:Uncharacterized protein n=1 Tax=Kineococcus gynurae TaxID=452979 RepID=A0ABV5LVD1_9ACTN